MAEAALSDLRIIDLSQGIAGPYCAKLFADLGAEVIKVEPPEGDRSRRLGPFPEDVPHPEKSGLFLHLNTGKKSVTLDINVTSGQAILKKLLQEADVLIVSEGPSQMAECVLSYDDLKSEFPHLVYVCVTPFGTSGPYQHYQANSLTAMAMSTIMYNTGEPDREPLTTGGTPAEYIAGIHAWIGALAALAYRAREGRGQFVDVSLTDAAADTDEYNAAMYAYQGAIRRRFYSRHVFGYPMDIMPCQDGYIVLIPGAQGFPLIGVPSEGAVSPMALLLERPELDNHVLFTLRHERMRRWREFDGMVLPWLRQHTAKEIVEFAQALRMPFALVPTAQDLLEDEHLQARGFFQRLHHPEAGELPYAGPPFRMSETPPRIGRAPLLGEHSQEILAEQTTNPRGDKRDRKLESAITKPLEGVRVLDFSQVYAGPTCTRIMADLGAEVIRLESPDRLDVTRALIHVDNDGKDVPWERTLYFTIRNAGKKHIVVDLYRPRGRELIRSMIALSDVVVENFTPRVMRAFELDYEHVRGIRPDVIMISLSGYGQDGPYSDWSAYGMGLEPASGISQLTGYPGGPPLRSGMSFTDPVSGCIAAGAVLAALHYRGRTGKGQYIDLSQQEAAIPMMGAALMDFAMNGRLSKRVGNRSPWAAPQGCYRCKGDDEWLVISIESDDEWIAFCLAVGHPEWAEDERFADMRGRHRHHDELDQLIQGWTREQDHYDAFHLLQQAGVKAAPVLNGKEILFDPHFKERGLVDIVDQPHMGKRPVPRHLAAKFSDFEASARGPAPTFGQHNREVLGGLLGLSDDELRELEERGVIATRPNLPLPAELASLLLKLPYDHYLEMGILGAIEPDYREQLGLE